MSPDFDPDELIARRRQGTPLFPGARKEAGSAHYASAPILPDEDALKPSGPPPIRVSRRERLDWPGAKVYSKGQPSSPPRRRKPAPPPPSTARPPPPRMKPSAPKYAKPKSSKPKRIPESSMPKRALPKPSAPRPALRPPPRETPSRPTHAHAPPPATPRAEAGPAWTLAQIQRLRLLRAKGLPTDVIAARLQRSVEDVERALADLP